MNRRFIPGFYGQAPPAPNTFLPGHCPILPQPGYILPNQDVCPLPLLSYPPLPYGLPLPGDVYSRYAPPCYLPQPPSYPPAAYSIGPAGTGFVHIRAPWPSIVEPSMQPAYLPFGYPLPRPNLTQQPDPTRFDSRYAAGLTTTATLFDQQDSWTTNRSHAKKGVPRNASRAYHTNNTSSKAPKTMATMRHENHHKPMTFGNSQIPRSISADAVELSSITVDPDGGDYDTCDENEAVSQEEFPTRNPYQEDFQHTNAQAPSHLENFPNKLDYTMITNDKSFSYLNFDPKCLPTKLDRMWFQIEPLRENAATTKPGNPKEQEPATIYDLINSTSHVAITPADSQYLRVATSGHLQPTDVWTAAVGSSGVKAPNTSCMLGVGGKSCHLKSCIFCCCTPCLKRQGMNKTFEANHLPPASHEESSENWDKTRDENCNHISRKSSSSHLSVSLDAAVHGRPPSVYASGMWWDQSVDAGFTELKPSIISRDASNHKLDDDLFIQEMDDLVIVDTARSRNTSRKFHEFDLNHNVSKQLEDPSNIHCGGGDTSRKRLDVDWEVIRTVVPQEYIGRSYTDEGTAEVYNLGSSLVSKSDSSASTVETKIADDDAAIVAVIEKRANEGNDDCNNNIVPEHNTSTPHHSGFTSVQGKRVEGLDGSIGDSRMGWGKQDVKLLLLSTSAAPSVTESTPRKDPIVTSMLARSSKNETERTVDVQSNNQRKTLSPISTTLRESHTSTQLSWSRKIRSRPSTSAPSSPFRLSIYSKVGAQLPKSSSCQNIGSTTAQHRTPHAEYRDTRAKDATYSLTPASSVLEFLAPKQSAICSQKQVPRKSALKGKIEKTSHMRRSKTTSQLPTKKPEPATVKSQTMGRKPASKAKKRSKSRSRNKMTPDSAYTSPSSCASSRTITPAVSPEKLPAPSPTVLAAHASKTVVKSKRRKSVSSHATSTRRSLSTAIENNKQNLRTLPSKTAQRTNEVSLDTLCVVDPGETVELTPLTRSKIKVAKLRMKQDALKQKFNSKAAASNAVVGKKDRTRRSPRINKCKLSAPKESKENNIQMVEEVMPENDNSNVNKVLNSNSSHIAKGTPQQNLTSSSSAKVSNLVRGPVKSSIKSIVRNLVHQSVYMKPEIALSPSLCALKCGRNKLKVNLPDQRNLPKQPGSIREGKRPSSAPASPAPCSIVSQRLSTSLSDVFYDTTLENSWLPPVTSFYSDDSKPTSPTTNRVGNKQIPCNLKLNTLSTYVAFSPPTLNSLQLLPTSQAQVAGKNPHKCNTPTSVHKPRGRKLSRDLESKVRNSVKQLVTSVSNNATNGFLSNSLADTSQPDCTNFAKLNIQDDNKKVVELPSGSKTPTSRRKSLDIATQTCNENEQNVQTEDQTNHGSCSRLNVPPKKPPRSNSPNAQQSNQFTTTSADNNQPQSTAAVPEKQSVPYYHLFPAFTGISPLRQPPLLSSTLIPVNFEHQFIRSPTFPAFFVAGEAARAVSSGSTSSSQAPALQSYTYYDSAPKIGAAFPATVGLHALYPSEQNRHISKVSTSKTHRTTKGIPPYPYLPHPRGPPRKPGIRRRRSFPGLLSSAAVAKARLTRRVAASHYKQQYYRAAANKSSQVLNYSHPSGRVVRRPRFVRSSLTDDAVLETITKGSFSPTFITKTTHKKNANNVIHTKNDVIQTKSDVIQTKSDVIQTKNDVIQTKNDVIPLPPGKETSENNLEDDSIDGLEKEIVVGKPQVTPSPPESPPLAPSVSGGTDLVTIMENPTEESEINSFEFSSFINHDKHAGHWKNLKNPLGKFKRLKKYFQNSTVGHHSHTSHSSQNSHTSTNIKRSKTDSKLVQSQKKNKPSAEQPEVGMIPAAHFVRKEATYDMKSALLRQSFVAMAPSEVGVSTPSDQGTVREKIEQPRRGVATPGAQINSETGDLIDNEKCGADKRAHLHQLLSSTAIDTAADNQSIDFSADSLQTSPPKLPMVNESTEI